MHRLTVFAVVLLLASASIFAGPRQHYLEIVMGTATADGITNNYNGFVEAVYVAVSDGVSTGTVAVSYAPLIGGTSVNIATNIVTDEKVFRPLVDGTTVAGVDLTGDEPRRFVLAGEAVAFTVSGSPTGITWKCFIITSDE